MPGSSRSSGLTVSDEPSGGAGHIRTAPASTADVAQPAIRAPRPPVAPAQCPSAGGEASSPTELYDGACRRIAAGPETRLASASSSMTRPSTTMTARSVAEFKRTVDRATPAVAFISRRARGSWKASAVNGDYHESYGNRAAPGRHPPERSPTQPTREGGRSERPGASLRHFARSSLRRR